jgi:peptide/nickel transport system permease protein
MQMRFRFKPPSLDFPLGTDGFGRDVLSRLLHGARLSLGIGLSVALLSGVMGTLIGVASGHFKQFDSLLMRCMDALMAFPAIMLAIGITAVLGPQTASVIIALSVAYVPRTARIVRSAVLVIRETEYIQATVLGHW